MAKLPRGPARALRAAAGLALALAAGAVPAAPASAVELEGTWHVLVHYTDANTSRPEQPRWNDRVWVFERRGSRLAWTEYPIVVFGDESGRFERRASGQYARVLGAWEPDRGQLANIESGLRINTRGSRKKTLRGSDAAGWRTHSRPRSASASVITYQENWSIEGLPGLPVFRQEDQLGSARSETMEGVTRYATTAVLDGGRVLRGRFERDGTREGTFVMRRSGAVGRLEERDQSEIQARAARRMAVSSREARREAREGIEAALAAQGATLPEAEKEALVSRAIELFLDMPPGEARAELERLVSEKAAAGSE